MQVGSSAMYYMVRKIQGIVSCPRAIMPVFCEDAREREDIATISPISLTG